MNIGRVAQGAGVVAAAVTAGTGVALASERSSREGTLERGRRPFLDDSGITAFAPEALGVLALGAVGIATHGVAVRGTSRAIAGAGDTVGHELGRAFGRHPVASTFGGGALGAVSGWAIGRRIGIERAVRDETFAEREAAAIAERDHERAQYRKERDASTEAASIDAFGESWGAPDGTASIDFDAAAGRFLGRYDHDGDGSIDLRDGQQMRLDERVAVDRGYGLGGGGAPTDDDQRVVTHISDLAAFDGNDDQLVSGAELAAGLDARYDANGDDRLDHTEGMFPRGDHSGDYNDFEG